MSEQDELLVDFLVETKESLDHLDEELLALEASPSDRDLINSIFRRLHTIKGVCGFLDLHKLESVTHAGETLLGELRSDQLKVTDVIISLLLKLCDAIRNITESLEQTKTEGVLDCSQLASDLLAASKPESAPTDKSEQLSLDDEFEALLDQRAGDIALAPETPEPSINQTAVESIPLQSTQSPAADVPEASNQRGAVQDSSLRVDVQLLDHLMNLAGELVLARNQILQATKAVDDPNFRSITQRLNLVTSELQEGVMKTRMQPISTVWGKFPRVVRDLAISCKKQVRLEMHGKETELDKTLIEAIKDPLTHIVRNSIDHGVELPERRVAVGKPAEGCITMGAFQEGGYVIIEIVDDGAGLNTDKIRERAIERGLITRDRGQSMSEGDVHRLIFAPGFSTADTITNLSGRGVGMDVVKSSVEKIGGHVDIQSWAGEGSTIRLKIPLTLAIIPALLLSCSGHKFAVPQSAITELVQFSASERAGVLSWVGDYPFYRLREDLLPIVFLNKHLELQAQERDGESAQVIVVMDCDGCRFGVVVDQVHDTEEIVVKPLGRVLGAIQTYAGATILGDGQIALILDPVVLAKEARVEQQESKAELLARESEQSAKQGDKQLLVVQVSDDTRAAIPLHLVKRLEEFRAEQIERVGGAPVVQYRGAILPLLDVAKVLQVATANWQSGSVVVVGEGDRIVGLQVRAIVDVSADISAEQPVYGKPGIQSFGVIQGKVTAMLDINQLMTALGEGSKGSAPENEVRGVEVEV
ncbi:MAG: chemotaxis protein CheW [Pseudomonadota bacterium]|jgi:two-component system chemotaxis sensor kinase CheA